MRRLPFREITMLKNFDEMQKYGKEHMDSTMKAWGQVSKGVQAIAAETADYSKRSFEEGSAALEKLLGAKSLEKAIEIQAAYAKTAYEGFVAQATWESFTPISPRRATSRSKLSSASLPSQNRFRFILNRLAVRRPAISQFM